MFYAHKLDHILFCINIAKCVCHVVFETGYDGAVSSI